MTVTSRGDAPDAGTPTEPGGASEARAADGTTGRIAALARDAEHNFGKPLRDRVRLLTGLGVEGDAHLGETVQHRSRVAKDPTQPNLRQVHLIHAELFEEVAADGFSVGPGALGENVTTEGVDLLALPVGTLLRLGDEAVVELTGLRNPCLQIDGFSKGLMKRLVHRDADGEVVRLAGVMSVVVAGGEIRVGDPVRVELPAGPHRPLERV
ncbi:MOSC domain-containing protein [Streptomyces sp. XM4193]|uniref:MOSC domain-containing protein n=1 Tax=Streptomyces sp. XM4193 TaxID=2929782 RepID=UPI001FF7CC6D|nr:MOSC domain-containing protein [Streptomyces sp. XM4193]MCK1795577.1 MOSC domain-containing protein [Streptomyces sp. XM4193]